MNGVEIVWLHGAPAPIEGGFVLPADTRGVASTSIPGGVVAERDAIRKVTYRRDRAFVVKVSTTDPVQSIRGFGFGGSYRFVYQVEPCGELEPDPGHPSWFRCGSARVVRCLSSPAG